MNSLFIFAFLLYLLYLVVIYNREKRKAERQTYIKDSQELTNNEYDVIAGLHNLGYDKRHAKAIVHSVYSKNLTVEGLFRESLKRLKPTYIKPKIKEHIPIYKPEIDFKTKLDIPQPLLNLTQKRIEKELSYDIRFSYGDYEYKPIIQKPTSKPEIKSEVQKENVKPKVKRECQFNKLTIEDIKDLKNLLSENIFKRFSYISLAWLKTKAISQGIDDWISLIDSKLSYEENLENIRQQYGISLTDKEMLIQSEKYEAMGKEFYQGIGEHYDISR